MPLARVEKVLCLYALALVLFSGSAFAESAWVLWVTITDHKSPAVYPAEVAATYTNSADCIAAIDQHQRGFRASPTVIRRDAQTMLHVDIRGKDGALASSLSWLCAPDTVDPRGPKR
jgi:hypothetical protein